jgi:hypothetical protein
VKLGREPARELEPRLARALKERAREPGRSSAEAAAREPELELEQAAGGSELERSALERALTADLAETAPESLSAMWMAPGSSHPAALMARERLAKGWREWRPQPKPARRGPPTAQSWRPAA